MRNINVLQFFIYFYAKMHKLHMRLFFYYYYLDMHNFIDVYKRVTIRGWK